MTPRDVDPRSLLPLTPLACQVLLSLSDQARHGYGIIREIEDRTGSRTKVRTGTLYTLIQRLLAERLIEESGVRPSRDEDDQRRRYYGLTVLGQGVLAAEVHRLESVIADARRKRVLGRSSRT